MLSEKIVVGPVARPTRFAGRPFPEFIRGTGLKGTERFIEFFTVHIRNPNTRAAYADDIGQFCAWADARSLTLKKLRPIMIASYIEGLQAKRAAPSVKRHLAAIRTLFDWLVLGQVLPVNPAASVRGPTYIVKRGKTPILTPIETRTLLDSLPTDHVVGLRDRALIGVMTYAFARVSAVVGMKVGDYYAAGKRSWIRLHEKRGKVHELPAHHNAQLYLDEYLAAAGIAADVKGPLFRSAAGRSSRLNASPMGRTDVFRMIQRRIKEAGILSRAGCHTFRATGITTYLANGGKLERAQAIANHESAETTRIYDRNEDELTLDEIERIVI
jgi:site-specific recombinase XerD